MWCRTQHIAQRLSVKTTSFPLFARPLTHPSRSLAQRQRLIHNPSTPCRIQTRGLSLFACSPGLLGSRHLICRVWPRLYSDSSAPDSPPPSSLSAAASGLVTEKPCSLKPTEEAAITEPQTAQKDAAEATSDKPKRPRSTRTTKQPRKKQDMVVLTSKDGTGDDSCDVDGEKLLASKGEGVVDCVSEENTEESEERSTRRRSASRKHNAQDFIALVRKAQTPSESAEAVDIACSVADALSLRFRRNRAEIHAQSLVQQVQLLLDNDVPEGKILRLYRIFPDAIRLSISNMKAKVEFLRAIQGGDEKRFKINLCSSVLGLNVETAKKRIEYMKSIGMSEKFIIQITKRWPCIYSFRLEDRIPNYAQFFQQYGITRNQFIDMIAKSPSMMGLSLERIESKITALLRIGISTDDIGAMISRSPMVLGQCIEGEGRTAQKISFITTELNTPLKSVINFPNILSYSFESRYLFRNEVYKWKYNQAMKMYYIRISDEWFSRIVELTPKQLEDALNHFKKTREVLITPVAVQATVTVSK